MLAKRKECLNNTELESQIIGCIKVFILELQFLFYFDKLYKEENIIENLDHFYATNQVIHFIQQISTDSDTHYVVRNVENFYPYQVG